MPRRVNRLRRAIRRGARKGGRAAWQAAMELRNVLFGDSLFSESIVAGLTLLSVMTLAGDLVFEPGSSQARSIYRLDLAICILLAGEYILRLYNSRDRRGFLTQYWFEPLAFVPAAATEWASGKLALGLRLLRLVRVYRVLNVLGRESIYPRMIRDILREARLLQLLIVFVLGLGFTSLAVFMAESRAPNAGIRSLGDAFWWSLATVTTVGYGDVVPVTSVGKAVGVVLMLFGIAVLGGFISLSSTAVARVVSRYSELGRDPGKLTAYERLLALAGRAHSLGDDDIREMLSLIEELTGKSIVELLPLDRSRRIGAPQGRSPLGQRAEPGQDRRTNEDTLEPR